MHLASGTFGVIFLYFFSVLSIFQIAVAFFLHVSFSMAPDKDHDLPFKHRGFTHTFVCVILVFLISFLVTKIAIEWVGPQLGESIDQTNLWALVISGSISISWVQHIFEDMMTVMGVKPLWPLSNINPSGVLRFDSRWFDVMTLYMLFISLVLGLIVLDSVGVINVVDPTLELFWELFPELSPE